jgi:hypothetical protein
MIKEIIVPLFIHVLCDQFKWLTHKYWSGFGTKIDSLDASKNSQPSNNTMLLENIENK